MSIASTVILPGMDSTGDLLRQFCNLAPKTHNVAVVPLPRRTVAGYQELTEYVTDAMPSNGQILLIGESFSGPIAVKIAAQLPDRVAAIVLVASFVDPPASKVAKLVPWNLLFRLPLPAIVARSALLGRDALRSDIRNLTNTVRLVPPTVLADRMQHLLSVDVRAELVQCQCPILYVRPQKDRLVPRRCWEEIASIRPDAKLASIDGPHLILQTCPNEAWRRIVDFSGSIEP